MSSDHHDAQLVLVTGGTGGIGFATIKRLVSDGFPVISIDSKEPTEEQRQYMERTDPCIEFHECDVTNAEAVHRIIETVFQTGLHVRGLVLAHGIETRAYLHELTEDDFRRVFDVNVLGSMLVAQAVVRHWLAQDPSHDVRSIVHMSSVNGVIATPMHTAYGSSKGAIEQMTRAMAVELGRHGIRVNAVGPGGIRTALMDSLITDKPDALDALIHRTPMQRLAEPAEVASVISFLISDDSSYLTGQTLFIDGGRTVQNLSS